MSLGRTAPYLALVLVVFVLGCVAGFLYRGMTAQAEIDSIGRDVTIRDTTRHLGLLTNLASKNYETTERSVATYLYGDVVAMHVMLEQTGPDRFREQACALAKQITKVEKWPDEGSEEAKKMRERLAELQTACSQQKR